MENKTKKIEMYSTPTCHFCNLAKSFFNEHNIEYTDYNVAENAQKREEMLQKSGQMGIPVIYIEDEMVVGFDESRLRKLLKI